MTAGSSNGASARPRPRRAAETTPPSRRASGRALALPDSAQAGQVVSAAGNAIVAGAKVGRILGRSAWRLARQLPGANVVEQQAQRLRQAAAVELARLLEMPQNLFTAASGEDQRVMMLVRDAATDPEPLRTAMTELLERSSSANGRSREYLFGTIVSQLVPDEARILGVLAEQPPFPVVDVTAKQVTRSAARTVLANLSTVGTAAGVRAPEDTPTYLGRMLAFGLIEFTPVRDESSPQFRSLVADPAVAAAKTRIERGKLGNPRIVRKTVTLSALGREFWSACAPRRG